MTNATERPSVLHHAKSATPITPNLRWTRRVGVRLGRPDENQQWTRMTRIATNETRAGRALNGRGVIADRNDVLVDEGRTPFTGSLISPNDRDLIRGHSF